MFRWPNTIPTTHDDSASSLESAIIIEGIKMIYEKKHPIIVREHLNSYLPPRERTK